MADERTISGSLFAPRAWSVTAPESSIRPAPRRPSTTGSGVWSGYLWYLSTTESRPDASAASVAMYIRRWLQPAGRSRQASVVG